MVLKESQLRRVIRNILVEYGSGSEFDHLRTDLTDNDMKNIAERFCNFLLKQSESGIFKYVKFYNVRYRTDDYTFKGGESITLDAIVHTNEWKKERIEDEDMRGMRRVRYSDVPVNFFKNPWSGIDLDKLFAGTKYLKNLKTGLDSPLGVRSTTHKQYTFTILLFWPMWQEPEKRKLVFQELKEWLDTNENRKFTREEFGFPQINQDYL